MIVASGRAVAAVSSRSMRCGCSGHVDREHGRAAARVEYRHVAAVGQLGQQPQRGLLARFQPSFVVLAVAHAGQVSKTIAAATGASWSPSMPAACIVGRAKAIGQQTDHAASQQEQEQMPQLQATPVGVLPLLDESQGRKLQQPRLPCITRCSTIGTAIIAISPSSATCKKVI